jgi:hypothetical protein
MQQRNAKANLVRASIAFLVGESDRRSGFGLRRLTFMLMAESGQGPVTQRELGANETVEVRDHATRSIQHLRAAEVSLYRHNLIFSGRVWRIMNIVG